MAVRPYEITGPGRGRLPAHLAAFSLQVPWGLGLAHEVYSVGILFGGQTTTRKGKVVVLVLLVFACPSAHGCYATYLKIPSCHIHEIPLNFARWLM